ncbi:MAG TPA: hypothetical protein VFL83_23475 [Anaeromyxobacter sp.]|nr:hypothetical protein [Anaeromyxobacter sp.]
MKKLTATLAAALLLAACAEKVDPAQEYRDALPTAQAVQLGTPSADANPGAISVSRDALGQSPSYGSEYAQTSYWTAVTVNVGVWWTLTLVQVIASFKPTHCDDAECSWGPWPGDDGLNEWMFHVAKVGESYEYELMARPIEGAADWTNILTGTALPGVDRHHGSGDFTINFDAQDLLAHDPDTYVKEDHGVLSVTYDNTADVSIDATLVGGKNDDPSKPHMMDATYSFLDTGAGGTLGLRVLNRDTTERVSLFTRWNGTGAGRSDVQYSGAGGATPATASECWAGAGGIPPWVPAWGETYDSKVPFGDELTDCVFNPAEYLSLPALPQ